VDAAESLYMRGSARAGTAREGRIEDKMGPYRDMFWSILRAALVEKYQEMATLVEFDPADSSFFDITKVIRRPRQKEPGREVDYSGYRAN